MKTSEKFYTQALQELKKYRFKQAINKFGEATAHGHKRAIKCLIYWSRCKDKNLARDIILCAAGKI